MGNLLKIKRNAWNTITPGAPTANTLAYGELAWDTAGKVLYIGRQTDDTPVTTETVKVVPNASSSVVGIASFNNLNFVVSAGGDVQIKTYGVARDEIALDAIDGTRIADDAVDSEHIANDAVALGTQTTGNYAGTITGTANEIEVTGSAGEGTAYTIGLPNDVVISGNLTVQGQTTTVESNNVTINDKNIILAYDETGDPASALGLNGAGITLGSPTSGTAPSLTWNNSGGVDYWEFNKPVKLTIESTVDTGSVLDFGIYAN
jgi:hypothetical protein